MSAIGQQINVTSRGASARSFFSESFGKHTYRSRNVYPKRQTTQYIQRCRAGSTP